MTGGVNISITIDQGDLEAFAAGLQGRLDEARIRIQDAMAGAYAEIVRSNFGDFGVDCPAVWPPLSPSYAKVVGRSHATLYVTGALYDAVKLETGKLEGATVSVSDSDVPYATAHQYGNRGGNLPARPYFPFDELGNSTQFALDEVLNAAVAELERGQL